MNIKRILGLIIVTRLRLVLTGTLFTLLAGCTLGQDSSSTTAGPQTPDLTPIPINSGVVDQTENPSPAEISEPLPEEQLTFTAPLPEGTAASAPDHSQLIPTDLERFGIAIARLQPDAEAAHALGLPFGSTVNWNVMLEPPQVPARFWQVIRVNEERIPVPDWDTIAEVLAAYPGSFWVVGNEPDVIWQDNVTPQRYAEIYHETYTFIKEHDPTALVVIGGVSQPTPLRLAYLDIVLDTYESTYGQPMPVDVWNVHAFILREQEDSWGVGIPPGFPDKEGILYEIEDHDDLEILAQNIRQFRKWMADRGYADRPLAITEYGILMPDDYGFPPEDVATFMESTFDLFSEMVGEEGYALDDHRLVQWWFWYSLYDDTLYPTGNLWDEETGRLTDLGQTWVRYLAAREINPQIIEPADN